MNEPTAEAEERARAVSPEALRGATWVLGGLAAMESLGLLTTGASIAGMLAEVGGTALASMELSAMAVVLAGKIAIAVFVLRRLSRPGGAGPSWLAVGLLLGTTLLAVFSGVVSSYATTIWYARAEALEDLAQLAELRAYGNVAYTFAHALLRAAFLLAAAILWHQARRAAGATSAR